MVTETSVSAALTVVAVVVSLQLMQLFPPRCHSRCLRMLLVSISGAVRNFQSLFDRKSVDIVPVNNNSPPFDNPPSYT